MSDEESNSDLSSKALPFWMLWGGPMVLMLSMNFLSLPAEWTTVIISACLFWMGSGCAINALRCHRKHCYLASPVLLGGAVLVLLVGFAVVDFGSDGLTYVVWCTFALVMLTFLPEKMLGKYSN